MQRLFPFALVIAMLAGIPTIGIAQSPLRIPLGKSGELVLATTVRFGDVVLQPGGYRLHHWTVEPARHYVAVLPQGARPGEEVARSPCRIVLLDRKPIQTEVFTRTDPNGTVVVTEVRVRGEAVGHIVTSS